MPSSRCDNFKNSHQIGTYYCNSIVRTPNTCFTIRNMQWKCEIEGIWMGENLVHFILFKSISFHFSSRFNQIGSYIREICILTSLISCTSSNLYGVCAIIWIFLHHLVLANHTYEIWINWFAMPFRHSHRGI